MCELDARNALAREVRELIKGKLLGAQVVAVIDWLETHDAEIRKRALIDAADMLDRADYPEEAFKVREMITDV